MNVQRMALKMEFISANMKNMKNNETIMNSFQSMAQAVGHVNNPNFEQMSSNMQQFEKTMDDMLINGKMMEEVMSQNNQSDTTADNMLDTLKGELAMETSNQVNEAAMIQQKEMEFQENLKKLWYHQLYLCILLLSLKCVWIGFYYCWKIIGQSWFEELIEIIEFLKGVYLYIMKVDYESRLWKWSNKI